MAKKVTATPSASNVFSFDDLNSFLTKEVKSGGEIISKMKFEETEFIPSGIHVLDALTSARVIGGGIASNRFTVIAGPSATGKSFLALNYCKGAVDMGYSILYIDTEGTVNLDLIENFGIDTNKFRLENKLTTVEEFKIYMAKFLKKLEEVKAAGKAIPKMLIVVDSIGNFPSEKEINDAEAGENKQDMTRNKVMKSLFRIITAKLSNLGIGIIGVGHTYETMEIYSKTVLSGGCMNPDAKVKMADGSIKEIQNIIKGEFVETLQGAKEVLEKVQFDNKALYEIVLANGSKYICSSDHRFLTSEDWTNEENWKYVDELEENDDILMVF